jgi:hypothetical protein
MGGTVAVGKPYYAYSDAVVGSDDIGVTLSAEAAASDVYAHGCFGGLFDEVPAVSWHNKSNGLVNKWIYGEGPEKIGTSVPE